jgi:hypothetical protein
MSESNTGKISLIAHNSSAFVDPVFGLCSLKVLLLLLRGCEPRIHLLRQLAIRYNMPNSDVIIKYEVYDSGAFLPEAKEGGTRPSEAEWENASVRASKLMVKSFDTADLSSSASWLGLEQIQEQGQDSNKERSDAGLILPPLKSAIAIQPPAQPRGPRYEFTTGNHFEYTSALLQIRPSAKRTSAGGDCSKAVHQRWLRKEEFWEHDVLSIGPSMPCDCIGRCREGFCACFRLNTPCTSACQRTTPNNRHDECENTVAARRFSSRLRNLQAAGEECFLQDENFKSNSSPESFEVLIDGKWVKYVLFAGDPDIAAIFLRHDSGTWNNALSSVTLNEEDMKQLISLFTSGSVMADAFLEYLSLSVLESHENSTRTRLKCPPGRSK